ncbi:MAG: HAD hydrolase-like protein [Anaerolineae bacterium]|nr:HAD hydrolase-like protein [Anaerolineae bacterium]
MSLSILFDLDDTLLINRMDVFLPAYIQALNDKFHLPQPELLPTALSAATQAMLRNSSPYRTLEETFNGTFYPMINSLPEDHSEQVNDFYLNEYPKLRPITRQIPGVHQLLANCAAQGHTVAIATNPLFPKIATMQRIHWAGLVPDEIPIALVSTFEDFHFSKPHIEYYLEMLYRLNSPDRAVMIGNDFQDDIVPPNKIGMPTYYIDDKPGELPPGFHPLSTSGTLGGISQWLETVDQSMDNLSFAKPELLILSLRVTPALLDTMANKLSPAVWQTRPRDGEWSLLEIVCHLRDVDRELNLARIQRVLEHPGSFITSEKIDSLAASRNYIKEDIDIALNEFFDAREILLSSLSELTPDQWNSPALHSIYGPTNLVEIVDLMRAHDQTHTRQFLSTMNQVGDFSPM